MAGIDHITIAGRTFRVEVNWNATTAFLQAVGRDSIDELSKIQSFRPSELTTLMAACIAEGERLDGNTDTPTALDLGAIIRPDDVAKFLEIYIRQSSPQMDVDPPKKEDGAKSPDP